MTLDSGRAGRPVREPIEDNTRIGSTFDPITYEKGGGVLAMMESYIGANRFRRGVQRHLANHRHGVATSEDFFRALSKTAERPGVIEAFRSFVEQPGVPLVEVRRSADGRRLELTQSRFRPLGAAIADGASWKIPFCATLYQGAGSSKLCTLMTGATASQELPADSARALVMPNAGGAGYYRFSLEPAALDALIARTPQLPEGEALALADSVKASFDAGKLSFGRLLSASEAFARHPGYFVLLDSGGALLDRGRRIVEEDELPAFRARIGSMYGPRLQAIGFDPAAGAHTNDPAERQLIRSALLRFMALEARDPGLRATLVKAARESFKTPSALDTALRSLAWSVAAQDVGAPIVDVLTEKMLKSEDTLERQDAADALGAVESPELAAQLRVTALDSRVPERYARALLRGQFESPLVRDAAWQWLVQNRDALFKRLSARAHWFVMEVPKTLCDQKQRVQVEQVLASKVAELGTGELELARTLESIELCVAQKNAHAADIRAVL